jgi:hypothetical protein
VVEKSVVEKSVLIKTLVEKSLVEESLVLGGKVSGGEVSSEKVRAGEVSGGKVRGGKARGGKARGGWVGPEDAEEDVGGQRPRGGRLHHPGLPLPRVRPLLLREERVVRAPLQKQYGKSIVPKNILTAVIEDNLHISAT